MIKKNSVIFMGIISVLLMASLAVSPAFAAPSSPTALK